jgi:hypothetical protein
MGLRVYRDRLLINRDTFAVLRIICIRAARSRSTRIDKLRR